MLSDLISPAVFVCYPIQREEGVQRSERDPWALLYFNKHTAAMWQHQQQYLASVASASGLTNGVSAAAPPLVDDKPKFSYRSAAQLC